MSKFLLVFLVLVGSPVHAAKDTWWGRFCEKYLIADDPYQYEPVLIYIHSEAKNHDEFIDKLIAKYLEVGAMLHWNRIPEHRDTTRLFLRTIGKELRREQQINPRPDIEDVLDKYQKFE